MVGFYVEGPKNFFISRELWRLEISAVEEQRPFWELPWRPRAGCARFQGSGTQFSLGETMLHSPQLPSFLNAFVGFVGS